ncbi:hypothetical protein K523DRAFT_142401 [Schizophyllum commune Tattone D]|nr:hypothetical protein K523DRAFT_142401 [Schizophyllum commune Tattone D]
MRQWIIGAHETPSARRDTLRLACMQNKVIAYGGPSAIDVYRCTVTRTCIFLLFFLGSGCRSLEIAFYTALTSNIQLHARDSANDHPRMHF